DRQFALHRDEDLDHLDHTGSKFVAFLDLIDLLFIEVFENGDLTFGSLFEVFDLACDIACARNFAALERPTVLAFDHIACEFLPLHGDRPAAEDQIGFELSTVEQLVNALVTLFFEDADFVIKVLPHLLFFRAFDCQAARVLVLSLTSEDLDVNDGPLDARRTGQRSVAHIASLFTEDRAEQFLFGGQLRLALWRDFAYQNRAGFDICADPDDAALVEISERGFAYVRDVACDLFRTEFGVARLDLQLFDVDRSV